MPGHPKQGGGFHYLYYDAESLWQWVKDRRTDMISKQPVWREDWMALHDKYDPQKVMSDAEIEDVLDRTRFEPLTPRTEIDRARVVAGARMPADVVGIGNRVRYRDETTGREQTVSLVWPEASDITSGRVSVVTPIGVALLGLKQGARFDWRRRDGELRTLCVLEVLPASETEGAG